MSGQDSVGVDVLINFQKELFIISVWASKTVLTKKFLTIKHLSGDFIVFMPPVSNYFSYDP